MLELYPQVKKDKYILWVMKIFCAIKRRKNYGNILKKENVIKAGLTDEQKPKTRLLQEVLSL